MQSDGDNEARKNLKLDKMETFSKWKLCTK